MRRLVMWLFVSVVALAALVGLLIGAAYIYGLRALPENIAPAATLYPRSALEMLWVETGASGPMVMTRLSPLTWVKAFASSDPTAYRPESAVLTSMAARTLLVRGRAQIYSSIPRYLAELAATISISRHWSAEEAAVTILAESYFGRGLYGFEEAAQVYFKRAPAQLSVDEISALVALLKGPSYLDPWCHPDRLKQRAETLLARWWSSFGRETATDQTRWLARLVLPPEGACAPADASYRSKAGSRRAP